MEFSSETFANFKKYHLYQNKLACITGSGLGMLGNNLMSVYARPCCLWVLSWNCVYEPTLF
jgi:hypothetical protein